MSCKLEVISADEVDLDGKALAVRYREDPEQPGLVRATITAYMTLGAPDQIESSAVVLVAVEQLMSRDTLHARLYAEAASRDIGRVAWTEEN